MKQVPFLVEPEQTSFGNRTTWKIGNTEMKQVLVLKNLTVLCSILIHLDTLDFSITSDSSTSSVARTSRIARAQMQVLNIHMILGPTPVPE